MSTETALQNCTVYARRLVDELPDILLKAIERRERFPGVSSERLVESALTHSQWITQLEASLEEAKEFTNPGLVAQR